MVVFLVFCVWEFGALGVLKAESYSPKREYHERKRRVLWWDFVTITTVGYGDRYPTTNAGRIVGIFVMIAGVGLFGTLAVSWPIPSCRRPNGKRGKPWHRPMPTIPKPRSPCSSA